MRRTSILLSWGLATALPAAAFAAPVDDLIAKGFKVVVTTTIQGDFDGCERDRPVQLASGGVFTCATFSYMHARNPKAVLLKSKDGRFKLVVGRAVFDGAYA